MDQVLNLKYVVAALLYSAIGLIIYALGFYFMNLAAKGQLWKEIIDEHNTSLAVVMGAISLGIAIIIASAIHG